MGVVCVIKYNNNSYIVRNEQQVTLIFFSQLKTAVLWYMHKMNE